MDSFFERNYDWIVVKPIRIILILLVASVLALLVRRAIRRVAARIAGRGGGSARAAQRSSTLGHVLGGSATAAIYVIAAMLCLSELGVALGPLLAGAGVVGVALGFGAQTLVRDVLNGLFVVIEDQYGVGDVVDLGDAVGTVESVTLRATRVRGLDGTLWHVPNGEIRRAGNKSQGWARAILDIPVAYDADVEKVSAVISRTAEAVWKSELRDQIVESPELWGVESFGPDSVNLRLAVKTVPGAQWAVARTLRARLKQAFDEAGIEIPFPQRSVWLKSKC